jgi:hypothetical protein
MLSITAGHGVMYDTGLCVWHNGEIIANSC